MEFDNSVSLGPSVVIGEEGTQRDVAKTEPWKTPTVEFQASRLLPNAHGQTIFGSYLRSPSLPDARKIRVALDDGDSVVLHEDLPETWIRDRDGNSIVLVSIHGLGGCHRSGYVRRLAGLAVNSGWGSYRMDMRGAGDSGRQSEYLYHAGRSDDLLAAVKTVRQLNPESTIVVCGFSLGASITLHLMSNWAKEVRGLVSAAIAVAPPLDLKGCAYNLANGWNRIYDRKFANMLWKTLQQRPNVLKRFGSVLPKNAPRTLLDFDSQVTAPLGGYDSAEDYYDRFSTASLLSTIQQPTLIITSQDDPLIPFHVFDSVSEAQNVQLHATKKGGHLGFVGRKIANQWPESQSSSLRAERPKRHSVAENRWLERAMIQAIGRRFCDNWPE